EVVARASIDPRVRACCRPLIVGDPQLLTRALRLIGCQTAVRTVALPSAAGDRDEKVECWDPSEPGVSSELASVSPGSLDERAGRAAYEWLVAAARAALSSSIDAIVTAPLNKAALHLAGIDYPGHTEILAAECGTPHYAMMLYVPPGGAVRSA